MFGYVVRVNVLHYKGSRLFEKNSKNNILNSTYEYFFDQAVEQAKHITYNITSNGYIYMSILIAT